MQSDDQHAPKQDASQDQLFRPLSLQAKTIRYASLGTMEVPPLPPGRVVDPLWQQKRFLGYMMRLPYRLMSVCYRCWLSR